MNLIDELYAVAKNFECDVYLNELLSKHSSFKIGGVAKIFIRPHNVFALEQILKFCNNKNIKNIIIGNGSNILFRDEGFDGAVINIGSKMENLKIENDVEIVASAGTTLAKLACFAMENSLTGLEFCWGIPGTVGGGVFMNAGAYGNEINDVIVSSSYINKKNNDKNILFKDEMNMGYRYSCYMERENDFVITEARFRLSRGNKEEIKNKMDELMKRRKQKQPIEWPNAGSIFKRPEGNFAGTLIEQSGLKGVAIGGAKVSEKHAGFIINTGGATAEDILNLISLIRKKVFDQTGYSLETEIKVY